MNPVRPSPEALLIGLSRLHADRRTRHHGCDGSHDLNQWRIQRRVERSSTAVPLHSLQLRLHTVDGLSAVALGYLQFLLHCSLGPARAPLRVVTVCYTVGMKCYQDGN